MLNQIFVGGLVPEITEEELKALFLPVGEVVTLQLLKKPEKTFAFITFSTPAEATAAITTFNNYVLAGKHLVVEMAFPHRKEIKAKLQRVRQRLGEGQPITLFVVGLPVTASEEQLREIFSLAGEIADIQLIKGPKKGKPLAFVDMKTDSATLKAIGIANGYVLDGEIISVQPCKTSRLLARREITLLEQDIAAQLGETDPVPRRMLHRLIDLAGPDFAKKTLEDTLKIEAEGGMMLPDGSRRRTPGGVFFYLAKGTLSPELQQRIFPRRKHRHKRRQQETG